MFTLTVGLASLLATTVSSSPLLVQQQQQKQQQRSQSLCPAPDKGNINIEAYQLYPENVDFDDQSYIGSLYNASVVVYDPYQAAVIGTVEFPNITRTAPFHIGGVAWDPYKNEANNTGFPVDEITVLVDAAAAHETAGRDVSGDNYILRFSAATQEVLWSVNLTAVTGGRYGGPQDIEHDAAGNIYVLGTYPGTILRVPNDGSRVDEWYVPAPPASNGTGGSGALDTAVVGYTGLAAIDGSTLLVADARNRSASGGALYRFGLSVEKGVPVPVPITYGGRFNATESVIRPGDAIYLPPKYESEVLLITEHEAGVSVLRSRKPADTKGRVRRAGDNKWLNAEFLGRIPNDPEVAKEGGVVTAAIEIAGRVYLVEEWFTDPLVPGTSAGNRSSFPLVDITQPLDALVRAR